MTAQAEPITTPNRMLFVVFDRTAQTFVSGILLDRHPGPIIRGFGAALVDPNQLQNIAQDLDLLHIGYIADDGSITPIAPVSIITGAALLASRTGE